MSYLTDEPSTTSSTHTPASGCDGSLTADTSRRAKSSRETSQSSQEDVSQPHSDSTHSQASGCGITPYGSQDGRQMSLFGQGAAPASHSALPGCARSVSGLYGGCMKVHLRSIRHEFV